jgi:rubrerythrin
MFADVVVLLAAFFAGGVLVVSIQSLREHDPRVNLRAQVIASVRLSNARRELARLRERLDATEAVADRRLDYLREIADELGASALDIEQRATDLDHDESLCLASRCRVRAMRAELERLLCSHCGDLQGSHATDGLCPVCPLPASTVQSAVTVYRRNT